MGRFQCSTFFLAFVITISAITTSKASPNVIDARGQSISRGVHNGVAFANIKAHKFSYLNITSIGTDYVLNGKDCGVACVNISSCFSFNLAAFYDINGRILCEMLPSDKYNNSDKFVSSQSFHHFSIASPCMSGPCQNGGSCLPIYEENSYLCICVKGYNGSVCQTDIDDCASHPCKNNGTCSDRVNGFNCSCAPGFNGTQCETGFLSHYSTILAGNVSYPSHLDNFLAPAVGFNSLWVLCYRASAHGWAASAFHSRCDGKRDTVTIIKNGEYVFGGYTDIPWGSDGSRGYTSNAFIFSLRNKEGLGPFKSMVADPSHAIDKHAYHGLIFGNSDIRIAHNANSNTDSASLFGLAYSVPSEVQNSSTILAGTQFFTPDEVEVFYLD